MFENEKKGENMETKDFFYIYLHLKDRLDTEFAACWLLRWADATGSADIIYSFWRISLVCGSGIVTEVWK